MKRALLAFFGVIVLGFGCAQVQSLVSSLVPHGGRIVRVAGATVEAMKEIPPEQDVYIGRMVSARLLARYPLVDDPGLQRYVNLVGTVVASKSDRPDIPFRFGVLDTDDVNAMAAPGGYIFITKGLMKLFRNEDELAAVLAHEIAHVSRRHGIRMIKKGLWQKVATVGAREAMAASTRVPYALVNLADKATGQIVDVLLKGGYDRKFEYEADRLGQVYAARAGYDPGALRAVIGRLDRHIYKRKGALSSLKATHPTPEARMKSLGQTTPMSVSTPGKVQLRAGRFKRAMANLQ